MLRDSDAARVVKYLAVGAIFVAPFIAMVYRTEAGLVMMAIALGATSFLLHGTLDEMPSRTRRRLRLMVAVNVLLIVACLLAAGWLAIR